MPKKGQRMTAEQLANWKAKMAVIVASPEYKAKMAAAKKGHETTEETKAKIRAAKTTVEALEKARAQSAARTHTPETRTKLSALAKARKNSGLKRKWSKEDRKKQAAKAKARCTPEERRRRSERQKARGKAHNFRVDGKGKERDNKRRQEMDGLEYRLWRDAVFARDDWTCQFCGKRGGKLNADHVKRWADHPELRYDVTNGQTLCEDCHKKTPTYGNRGRGR